MPELPEVEVLRRSLEPRLGQRQFTRVMVHAPALREPLDRAALAGFTAGRRVTGLRRRAKFLLIDLEDEATLVVHLGMSGRLTVVPAAEPLAKHEHVAFHLAADERYPEERLRLVDPRRFGLVFALPTAELPTDRHFKDLGVEPLADAFNADLLAAGAQKRSGPLKQFLMDGQVVVGVGNIYACEALWRARVSPRRAVSRVSAQTWERVVVAVRAVLSEAITQGGTTLNDFADGAGNPGYFQVQLAVYGREGEPCFTCGQPISRQVQAGRSTFYCSRCQR